MLHKQIILALLIALPGGAAEYKIDTAHSSAQFSVRHLTVSNVRGEFGKVTGSVSFDPDNLQKSSIEAVIDAASISTREPKRDEHLKGPDFLDVSKYPSLRFKSTSFDRASGGLRIRGDLTIHGVTRPTVLVVEGPTPEIKDPWGGVRVGASAVAKVSRKDFSLGGNTPLEAGGLVIGDEVSITLEVELLKQSEPVASKALGVR